MNFLPTFLVLHPTYSFGLICSIIKKSGMLIGGERMGLVGKTNLKKYNLTPVQLEDNRFLVNIPTMGCLPQSPNLLHRNVLL